MSNLNPQGYTFFDRVAHWTLLDDKHFLLVYADGEVKIEDLNQAEILDVPKWWIEKYEHFYV